MKSLKDMRIEAAEYLQKIKAGTADKEDVRCFCQLCNLILSSLKVEIEYNKKLEKGGSIDFIEGEVVKRLT